MTEGVRKEDSSAPPQNDRRGADGKILRCAQNDKKGAQNDKKGAQNDKKGAQNDNGTLNDREERGTTAEPTGRERKKP